MNTTIIVKIESGVISDIYASEPVQVIVVDHDVIEGGETFEQRVNRSVSIMLPDKGIRPEDIEATVTALVLECKRPVDEKPPIPAVGVVGAAA